MNTNPFKTFRDPIISNSGPLKKSYDEPTYLSFSLLFYPKNNNMNSTNYDQVPHPLFNIHKEDEINARNFYSTYQYLRDIKEPQRARMLEKFIDQWRDLQLNNQWYFQSIDGINNLLSFDPNRGIRVSQTDGTLTINMLEGIDQRVFNLLTMYRKIAWDDVYQRWVLPDLMRYFSMDIYVTEFRTFHEPLKPTPEQASEFQAGGHLDLNQEEMFLRVLDNTIPTYIIKCEMCEFDLTSLNFENMNALSIAEKPDQFTSSFRVKVGKVYEEYVNPIQNLYWSDALINHNSRTYDYEEARIISDAGTALTGVSAPSEDPLRLDSEKNRTKRDYSLIAQDQHFAKKTHRTGQPWYESEDHLRNSSPEAGIEQIDATNTSGWIESALTFGKAYAENFVESKIDKAKMSNINLGGLNIGSFNEISAAFDSQNFMSLFGMVRRTINQNIAGTVPLSEATTDSDIDDFYIREPRQRTRRGDDNQERRTIPHGFEEKIADETFQNFLLGIIESKATNSKIEELKKAANLVLNDEGKWNELKDYSLATDLTSSALDEKNIDNEINKGEYGETYKQLEDRSLATDLDGGPKKIEAGNIIEGTPSSKATNNKIQE